MNTYGLLSINICSFNYNFNTKYNCKKKERDLLTTFLKIHNLTLNILEYLPYTSFYSGLMRMGTGLMMIMISGNEPIKNESKRFLEDHFYSEMIITGAAQMTRGWLLWYLPTTGKVINLILDILATFINWNANLNYQSKIQNFEPQKNILTLKPEPLPFHKNPSYPFIVKWLHVV